MKQGTVVDKFGHVVVNPLRAVTHFTGLILNNKTCRNI